MSNDPLAVRCPRCGALPRFGCHAISDTGHWAASTHAARWKAIGINRPSAELRVAEFHYARKHRQDLMREFAQRMHMPTKKSEIGR